MDKILIIDGLNFIYRSNHIGAKKLGKYGIVYSFYKNLRSLVEMFSPDKIFFCTEGMHNFRKELSSEYKANRIVKYGTAKTKEEADDFNRQRDIIIDLLKYLPITIAKSDKYEADDVIATLVEDLQKEDVVVVSNDSDLTQLLQRDYGPNIRIYNPFKKIFVSAPSYFCLVYKSLAGDKSDNISGLISKKKAEILANDPEKLKKFLSNEENNIAFNDNIELIKLRRIPDDQLEFVEGKSDWSIIEVEFCNMEFKSLLEKDVWERFRYAFEELKL